MTTPTPAQPDYPAASPRAKLHLTPRSTAAWALVGYAALHLLFSFFDWVLPDGGTFTARSADADFRSLFVMAMPLVAVLLAVHVSPPLGQAKLISAIAVVEYAVSLLFGLFTLLIGLGAVFDGSMRYPNFAFDAMGYFVLGIAGLVLIAVAAWVALRAYVQAGGTMSITIGRPPQVPH
jgi:hypothetical protein